MTGCASRRRSELMLQFASELTLPVHSVEGSVKYLLQQAVLKGELRARPEQAGCCEDGAGSVVLPHAAYACASKPIEACSLWCEQQSEVRLLGATTASKLTILAA